MYVYMYIYIPKYKLLILNDVIFMYVLKINDLVLDKHLVIFPWGRLFRPLSASRVYTWWAFPIHFGMFIVVFLD